MDGSWLGGLLWVGRWLCSSELNLQSEKYELEMKDGEIQEEVERGRYQGECDSTEKHNNANTTLLFCIFGDLHHAFTLL